VAVLHGPALARPITLDAVVLDMDGVVTDTARVHLRAWTVLFDGYLSERARTGPADGIDLSPFTEQDYLQAVDGKRREDGVAAFLASRGIDPEPALVASLSARKNDAFVQEVRSTGVEVFDDCVAFLATLRAHGVPAGLITASRNADLVLRAAGLVETFPVRVDGVVAADLGLPGKPDPAVFLEAGRRLGSAPGRTVVVEDAVAGVQAGRAGGFALVVGVDRTGGTEHADALRAHGADVVVSRLDVLEVGGDPR
jgi:beta-phosphoglucomutase family hydrolase